MDKLPVSNYIKEYYAEHGIQVDDFSKAAIIWNGEVSWCEKLRLLRELYAKTKDEGLKKQLKERLEHESEQFDLFMQNQDKKYIYKVTKYDDGSGHTYFTNVNRAIEYGKKNCEATICVDKIIVDPNEDEYGAEYHCVWNKAATTVLHFFQYMIDPFEECFHGKPNRFERAFLPDLVVPFQRGDIVKNIYTGDVGVVSSTEEEWNRLVGFYKSRPWEMCFSDMDIAANYVDSDGEFTHHHMCFLHCKKLTEYKKSAEMDMMEFLSQILQGKGALCDFRFYRERLVGK